METTGSTPAATSPGVKVSLAEAQMGGMHLAIKSFPDTMGYMNPNKTNNEKLKELVTASGLSQPAALAIFNLGLGPAAYSINTWKAFLASPSSRKFRLLKDDLLAHAEKNFRQHIKSL